MLLLESIVYPFFCISIVCLRVHFWYCISFAQIYYDIVSHNTVDNNFTAFKFLYVAYSFCLFSWFLETLTFFKCLHSFVLSRVKTIWNHTAYVFFMVAPS